MEYNDKEFQDRMQELEDWLVERELRRDMVTIILCVGVIICCIILIAKVGV